MGLACCPPQGSPSPFEIKKIMVENHDPLKCPLCQGHGELLRSEVIKQLTNGELKPWIDAYLAEIAQLEPLTELATAPLPVRVIFKKMSIPGTRSCPWGGGVQRNDLKLCNHASARPNQSPSLCTATRCKVADRSPNGYALRRIFL